MSVLLLLQQFLGAIVAQEKRLAGMPDALASLQAGQVRIIARLQLLDEKVTNMSQTVSTFDADLATLQADVTGNGDVIQSAVAAFGGLAAQIATITSQLAAAGVQPAQLAALESLHTTLASQKQMLAEAVAANTPAATTPTPMPPAPVPPTPAPPIDGTATESTALPDPA